MELYESSTVKIDVGMFEPQLLDESTQTRSDMMTQSEIAGQLRAHGTRCRELAKRCPSEGLAAEFYHIAEGCIRSAVACDSEAALLQKFGIKHGGGEPCDPT